MLYVDATALSNPFTGIGKTVDYLIKAINRSGINSTVMIPPELSGLKKLLYYNAILPRKCKNELSDKDIFLIPNNLGKYVRLPHKRTWVIVHDLIPLSQFGYRGIKRYLYRLKMCQIKNAEKILTISETVKKQLIDNLKISPGKIEVLYWPSPMKHFINDKICSDLKSTRPYFLSIGTGEPRKYIEPLIDTWEKVAPQGYDLKLFGGEWRKGAHQSLNTLIESKKLKDRVHLLGKVCEEDLLQLYKNAVGFIFPSLEEGFGLPPLEALSVGTPIILPKTPINYELYGSIAHFYSIGNVGELRQALNTVVMSDRDTEAMKEFCSMFSTQKFDQKITDIFNEETSAN